MLFAGSNFDLAKEMDGMGTVSLVNLETVALDRHGRELPSLSIKL